MKIKILALAIVAVLMVLVAGCDVEVTDRLYGVQGYALDITTSAAASTSLSGAEITLTNLDDNSTVTATVSGNGTYSIVARLVPGRYRLTGSKSGWTFIPQEYYSGLEDDRVDMLAFPEADPTTLTIAMAWDNAYYDIDLVATYGPANEVSDITLGGASARGQVYYGKTDSDPESVADGYVITLERDVELMDGYNVPRVEMMSIVSNLNDYPTTELDASREQIRVFANAYSYGTPANFDPGDTGLAEGGLTGALAEGKPSANVTMFVMLGNEHFGTWYGPIETLETTLHMVTIDLYMDGLNKMAKVMSAGNYGLDTFRSAQ